VFLLLVVEHAQHGAATAQTPRRSQRSASRSTGSPPDQRFVTAYLDGALPESVVAIIEGHLADCRHCREYLNEMRSTPTEDARTQRRRRHAGRGTRPPDAGIPRARRV